MQIDDQVRPYVDNYEFRADEGDHTPTDGERAMIEDAIHGFIAEHWNAFHPLSQGSSNVR